jgi:hypothetical protein
MAGAQSLTVTDPQDMADSSGDIRSIQAYVLGENLVLSMTVHGVAAPSLEQTPEGMNNRYYYHWILDTDNNPATGRSNAEYEGNPTGVTTPIGYDLVVMIGWRDGKPNGVYAYDPADEGTRIVEDFAYQAAGNTLTAEIPLADLGLVLGQTIAVSAFQEGASDGWAVDWMESGVLTLSGPAIAMAQVTDPQDMADSSGDLRAIQAYVLGDDLVLSMTVHGVAAPSVDQTPAGMNNRYYYHWILDTDNNPATGRSNAEYEGNPTGVTTPIGYDLVVMIGWRDGKPNGVYAYDPADEGTRIVEDFAYLAAGNTLSATIPLADLGLVSGQTIAVSAFQEGASDGWAVDWMESETLTLTGPTAPAARVTDPQDMADSSGDIRSIQAHVMGDNLVLSMTVHGVAAPSIEQTPDGMNNRYYYHWILDTDNNPATGRSNAEYEGNPTGVTTPIGYDLVVMIGWRDGKPNGVYAYDPADEGTRIVQDFAYQAAGNTLTAVIPLADLGLVVGQTIALSGFQEGASDGWAVDWAESATLTLQPVTSGRMKIDGEFGDWAEADAAGFVVRQTDPQDMADSSGDIRAIEATVEDGYLYLRMTMHGVALPSIEETPPGMQNRYYYHWILDTDNNPATGRSNAEYEGNPTGVSTPIGYDLVVMIGWRDGAPSGVYAYDPADEGNRIVEDFEFQQGGDSVEARLRLADLGLVLGQTIALSAFQEGASDGWAVDWMESIEMTLTESTVAGMDLPSTFAGNAYGFQITVTDTAELAVDPASVTAKVDGVSAEVVVTKDGGMTTIAGRNPSLLEGGSAARISLSLQASGTAQAQDYTLVVKPYTVLPLSSRLGAADKTQDGFTAQITAIWSWQSDVTSLHNNVADLAEQQLVGGFTPEGGGSYINEAYPEESTWKVQPEVITGPINWYELAPAESHHINFTPDDPIPLLSNQPGYAVEGLAIELVGYYELSEGYHSFGAFTEGGLKVTAGLTPDSPLVFLFDNAEVNRVPTYHARGQVFDVVAPRAGYYPLRILWFQSHSRREPGAMLELYTVDGQTMHLVNNASDPQSIMVYRAGFPGVDPEVSVQVIGDVITLHWQGWLQSADTLNGPWSEGVDDSQSPMTVSSSAAPRKFYRAKSD